jgi:hypothetical protein
MGRQFAVSPGFVQPQRHRMFNFGKVVLNEVRYKFPKREETEPPYMQEL